MEELLASIEQAQATAAVLERLKQGNEALRRAQSSYSIEDVQNVLSDLEEAKEREEEVNVMLSERLTQEDDAAAEAELEALEAEEEAARAKTKPNANAREGERRRMRIPRRFSRRCRRRRRPRRSFQTRRRG